MTEDEARDWVATRYPAAMNQLTAIAKAVIDENGRQNLIAPSTVATIWSRHMVDSLQLLGLVLEGATGTWVDIGTGGGFPGLAVAIVWTGKVILVEPRRRRAEFLTDTAARLGLTNVDVRAQRIEMVRDRADIVSARAVASITELVAAAGHVSSDSTRWLLPRGKVETDELDRVGRGGFMFHVEQSLTSDTSSIVILDDRRDPSGRKTDRGTGQETGKRA